nr:EOG090X06MA [Lepidurus arcticus]
MFVGRSDVLTRHDLSLVEVLDQSSARSSLPSIELDAYISASVPVPKVVNDLSPSHCCSSETLPSSPVNIDVDVSQPLKASSSAHEKDIPIRDHVPSLLTPRESIHRKFGLESSLDRMSRFLKLAHNFNCFYLNDKVRHCKPFFVAGTQVGLVPSPVVEAMKKSPRVFEIGSDGAVFLHPNLGLASYEERSKQVDAVLRQWREQKAFITLKGWRDECFEVRDGFADPPLLKMERAATCLFGLRQYGVDINGYTHHPSLGFCVWLQKRSVTKPTWPGALDNMVGGGLSVGHSIIETALKEAAEEASIPEDLLKDRLKSVGSVSFYFESERGLFPNTEFVFDLELPPEFEPCNADGEVESFELVPVKEVMERILYPEFKTTSCAVTLDFLIRHGFINSENEPNLPELVELLHIPLHKLYTKQSNFNFKP